MEDKALGRTSHDEVEHLYGIFNRERFAGALPPYRIKLLHPRSDSRRSVIGGQLGACNHEHRILWVDSELSGSGLHRVLLHEMCHVATRHERTFHGPRFLAVLQEAAAGEAWLADEVAMYEDRIPEYPPGMDRAVVVRLIIDSFAHRFPDKQWRRVRRGVASSADMSEEAFEEEFSWAAEWWREASG